MALAKSMSAPRWHVAFEAFVGQRGREILAAAESAVFS